MAGIPLRSQPFCRMMAGSVVGQQTPSQIGEFLASEQRYVQLRTRVGPARQGALEQLLYRFLPETTCPTSTTPKRLTATANPIP
jgi:hypothetical protein